MLKNINKIKFENFMRLKGQTKKNISEILKNKY